MGRTEPSIVRPPAAFRRDVRAKKAKATINKLIPSLLSAHPRARRGIEASELIVSPSAGAASESSVRPGSGTGGPRLTVRSTDTLTAAHTLLSESEKSSGRVAILNMASPLSPGGGFLNGATSQEEFLCMRTTLLPSLRDEFYRLPEVGCVYTPDVLVFRTPDEGDGGENDMLEKRDRWFVDVVSAAMLRQPETEVDEDSGHGSYVHAKDRELVVEKMRAVMRVLQAKGVTKAVLGAWGCGAYGNPVGEVARAWRKVLLPTKSNKKRKQKGEVPGTRNPWNGIEQVVFAIRDVSLAEAFTTAFGDELEMVGEDDEEELDDEESLREAAEAQELNERMQELKLRIGRAPDARVRQGLEAVLAGLESQNTPAIAEDGPGDSDSDG